MVCAYLWDLRGVEVATPLTPGVVQGGWSGAPDGISGAEAGLDVWCVGRQGAVDNAPYLSIVPRWRGFNKCVGPFGIFTYGGKRGAGIWSG